MFLQLRIAIAATNSVWNNTTLLIEPKLTDSMQTTEYNTVLNKWYLHTALKYVLKMIPPKMIDDEATKKGIPETDKIKRIQIHHELRVKIIEKYIEKVKVKEVTKNTMIPIRLTFLECLKDFPGTLDLAPSFHINEIDLIKECCKVSTGICYLGSYNKCLTQYIYHEMIKRLGLNDNTILIWHHLVVQMYHDTFYSVRSDDVTSQNVLPEIQVNAEMKCIKSSNFFKDALCFLDDQSTKKHISLKQMIGCEVIIDISPYLIFCFYMTSIQKGEANTSSSLLAERRLADVMSFLSLDENFLRDTKNLHVTNNKRISLVNYPRSLESMDEILAFTNIRMEEYQECMRFGVAVGYIMSFYIDCLMKPIIYKSKTVYKKIGLKDVSHWQAKKIFECTETYPGLISCLVKLDRENIFRLIYGVRQSYETLRKELEMEKHSFRLFYRDDRLLKIKNICRTIKTFEEIDTTGIINISADVSAALSTFKSTRKSVIIADDEELGVKARKEKSDEEVEEESKKETSGEGPNTDISFDLCAKRAQNLLESDALEQFNQVRKEEERRRNLQKRGKGIKKRIQQLKLDRT